MSALPELDTEAVITSELIDARCPCGRDINHPGGCKHRGRLAAETMQAKAGGMKRKRCPRCKTLKPVRSFNVRDPYCRPCRREYQDAHSGKFEKPLPTAPVVVVASTCTHPKVKTEKGILSACQPDCPRLGLFNRIDSAFNQSASRGGSGWRKGRKATA